MIENSSSEIKPMECEIPIVDFGAYGLGVKDTESVTADTVSNIAESVMSALHKAGCFYMKNHGMDEALLAEYNDISRHFFDQPTEVKQKFARQGMANFGWMGMETEGLDPDTPMDLKECFNYCPPNDTQVWTTEKKFPEVNQKLFDEFTRLAVRLNHVFSVGLGQDADFMRQSHDLVGKPGNSTTIRPLYYAPSPTGREIKKGQIRCGAHPDFDTYSVLFQDNAGGLEAEVPGRGWVPVKPTSGLAVILIGEVIGRWTAGKLTATNHRVVADDDQAMKDRQCVAYFLTPNDDVVVKCLDGSDKYAPIMYKDFVAMKFGQVLY